MQPKGKAFDIFMGVMIAIMGNFFVSTIIEMANSVFDNKPVHIYAFWDCMFIGSSILTFQFTKFALKNYFSQKRFLSIFNIVTVILVSVGILAGVLYATYH